MKRILAIVMVICMLFALGSVSASAKLDWSRNELSKLKDDDIVYSAIRYKGGDNLKTYEFSYWVQENYLADTIIWDVAEKQAEFFEAYKEYIESKRKELLSAGEAFFEKHFDTSADELVFNSDKRTLIAVKSTVARVKALENVEGCSVFAVGDLERITERYNTNNWATYVPEDSSLKGKEPYELVYALHFFKGKETPRYCGDGYLGYFYSPLYYHYPQVTDDEVTADEPDYLLVYAGSNSVSPAFSADYFDEKYLVQAYNCYDPYILGLHIIDVSDAPDYKVYSLREAWDMGFPGIEDVFTNYGLGEIRGDSDGDKKITIKDATYVQKCIAGIDKFEEREYVYGITETHCDIELYGRVSDVNLDGKVDVKDATAIQKFVAGLEFSRDDVYRIDG